jgi:iron complex outermembrane receptor protein
VSGGSQGLFRFTADMTGPLTADRRIRYRVVAAPEWLENGFDNDERRLTLMPMVAFDVGARGTLTVDMELYHQRGRSYRHVVLATAEAQAGDLSRFPWELNINGPDYGWTGSNVSPGLRLDWPLGQRSSVHVAGRYTRIKGDINGQGLLGVAPDGRAARRFQYHEVSTWDEYQSDSFATTTLRTGPLEHRLVGGVEAGLSTTDSQIGSALATPLDLLNPVYATEPEPPAAPVRFDITRVGLYAVDQIRFGERVVLVPGLRWSHLGVENHVATTGEARSDEDVVSPSVGLVVLPRPWLSLYTNYTQGFEPPVPGQYLEDGRALAAARNRALEAGVKADLIQQRMSVTGAVYRIRRTNVPEADPRGFYRQIGEAESHGLELEAVGTLARGLGLRAGYSWTGTDITRDTGGFVGFDLPNAPRHKTEIWARYRFPQGVLSRLTIAGGAIHVSSQFTARDNAIVAPGFTRFDASASYELAGPRLGIALVAQNLTNRRYVTSGAGASLYAAPLRRIAVQLTTAY